MNGHSVGAKARGRSSSLFDLPSDVLRSLALSGLAFRQDRQVERTVLLETGAAEHCTLRPFRLTP